MFKVVLCSLCLLPGLLAGNVSALEMTVSPNVLVVSAPGDAVRIHTNMPAALVDECQLTVNGTDIGSGTGTDSCGNLVILCSRAAVVGILANDATTAEFSLTVTTVEGTESTANDTVPVKR